MAHEIFWRHAGTCKIFVFCFVILSLKMGTLSKFSKPIRAPSQLPSCYRLAIFTDNKLSSAAISATRRSVRHCCLTRGHSFICTDTLCAPSLRPSSVMFWPRAGRAVSFQQSHKSERENWWLRGNIRRQRGGSWVWLCIFCRQFSLVRGLESLWRWRRGGFRCTIVIWGIRGWRWIVIKRWGYRNFWLVKTILQS